MRVAILMECELARSHGTGAQVLAIFAGENAPDFHQFYYRTGHGAPSETAASTPLLPPPNPFPRGVRAWADAMNLSGIGWWQHDRVKRRRLQKFLTEKNLRFDVAYAVAGRERDCRRFNSVLKVLGCPYIVQIMDLFDANGLSPAKMPGFKALLGGAVEVLALTPAIAAEVQKFRPAAVHEVMIGQAVTDQLAAPPAAGAPLRIIINGRPYPDGASVLAQALPALQAAGLSVEIQYVGMHFEHLPPNLRPHVRNLGFLTNDPEYRAALAAANVGFLSGPDTLDCYGKYSFPSRCSDFLMAGLPVIARVAPGSATEQVLAPLIPESVRTVATPEDIVAAVRTFTAPAAWSAASTACREFALKYMDITAVRTQIFAALARAASSINDTPAARGSSINDRAT